MFQEYLFSDKVKQAEVKKYNPVGVTREIVILKNTKCWIATYSVPYNNEQTAKTMSDLNKYVVETFHPTVLTNESSEYFCKSLFPLIHAFERKLRKMLYLKSALYDGNEALDMITNLEEKDLGTIFELLFTDREFVLEVQKRIKKMTWQFSKDELSRVIQKMNESKLWDKVVGENAISPLRNDYLTVKGYRNDVMHAHNLDYETYRAAKKLFSKINEQLDEEIGKVITIAEEGKSKNVGSAYSAALREALQKMDTIAAASKLLMEQTNIVNYDVEPLIHVFQEMMKEINTDALSKLVAVTPLITQKNALSGVKLSDAAAVVAKSINTDVAPVTSSLIDSSNLMSEAEELDADTEEKNESKNGI